MEIIPGAHLIESRAANSYLILDESGLTLIDAGLPRNHIRIFAYLSDIGQRSSQIKHIIITHADGDHYGSLRAIKEASGASVYASQREAEAIQAGLLSRPLKLKGLGKLLFQMTYPIFKPKPVQVDHILEGGESLPIFGGLQVIPTPGHTPEHISLYAPQHQVLFVGDSLRTTHTGELIPARGANTWDEELAWESVLKQATLKPEVVCPGHGPVIFEAADKFPNGLIYPADKPRTLQS